MGLWFREWLKMGTAVALLGGLLWLAVERDVGLPALSKSAAWGLVVWVAGGLIWIGLQYGHRREAAREWSRNRVTSSGFSPVNRAPRTGSAGSTAAHSTVEVFTVDGATAAGMAAETPILPPRNLVPHQRNGQLYYVYADPDVCECLYVGAERSTDSFSGSRSRSGSPTSS